MTTGNPILGNPNTSRLVGLIFVHVAGLEIPDNAPLNVCFDLLFRDRIASAFDTRKLAKYLAIKVVTTLDRFIDPCALVPLDDGYLEGN